MVIQYVILVYAAIIGACDITMAVGSYLYGIAMSECVKGTLNEINRHVHDKTNKARIVEEIIEFVQFHSRVKQLSKTYCVSHH